MFLHVACSQQRVETSQQAGHSEQREIPELDVANIHLRKGMESMLSGCQARAWRAIERYGIKFTKRSQSG